MRMWLKCDPVCQCNEHIKRELREIYQIVEIVKGNWDTPTWVGDGSSAFNRLYGHAIEGQIDTRKISHRWQILWDELDRRGEALELSRDVPEWPLDYHIYAGEPTLEYNLKDLADRCKKCRKLIGEKQ